ncbi:MAG: VWA-like domain-containing protein [Pseudomonadota bacterium]
MTAGVHSHRARPALQTLAERDPALAALSLWCLHRDGARTETVGSTITYGPDFADLAAHEQQGLAAHHILHVAFRHSARMATLCGRLGDAFDAARWNMAADAIINEALLAASHALPRPAVTLTGLLKAELDLMIDPVVALADWDLDRLYHALAPQNRAGQGSGEDDSQSRFAPDVTAEDHQSGTAAQDQEDAARWRQHVTRAMDTGRQAGRGLGQFGHRIADIPEPQTPWEVILRRLLTRAATPLRQPSPSRPSRRWLAGMANATQSGTAVPAFEYGTAPLSDVPRIVVAMDASGSVDDARLALFWAEVLGLTRRLRAEVHLLVFDDAIRHHERLQTFGTAPKVPDMPRGGGTRYAPVFDAVRQLDAVALVVLTDLEADLPQRPKGARVIWAVPTAHGLSVPYGHLLDLSA